MKGIYREICENRDWRVTVDNDGVAELEKYSPAGEDFTFTARAGHFVEDVKEYAASFDIDEHIEMWLLAKRSGTQGVPTARELVHDAEAIDKMLQELACALQNAELEAESKRSMVRVRENFFTGVQ